mmetsp:Transcript_24123/g.51443  ORF Transcript_24123/g.51443 Transcript_24123/m.51443 type:complete len:472 (+) Transcript_24123:96-1511(+)
MHDMAARCSAPAAMGRSPSPSASPSILQHPHHRHFCKRHSKSSLSSRLVVWAALTSSSSLVLGGDADLTLGNTVPGRNVPPLKGCTAVGQSYQPMGLLQGTEKGWDWCQYLCTHSEVLDDSGKAEPCVHFNFYPNGHCYLTGAAAELKEDEWCNTTSPCENGFAVVSGPLTCTKTSLWAFPEMATTPPPPTEQPLSGNEAENGTTAVKFAKMNEDCDDDTPCAPYMDCLGQTFNSPGICAPRLTTEGSTTTTITSTSTTIYLPFGTAAPPPEGATATGYFYEPVSMQGTSPIWTDTWKSCHQLCVANPFCEHWGYWPDHTCTQQGSSSILKEAKCKEGEKDCGDLKVVSGPRDLTDASLWPFATSTSTTTTKEPLVKAKGFGLNISDINNSTNLTEKVLVIMDRVSTAAPTPEYHGTGFNHWMLFLGVLALVSAIGFGVYQSFGRGNDDDHSQRSLLNYDQDHDEEDPAAE